MSPLLPGKPASVVASVIINNHNYGRFLGESIDSALAQTYAATEVIVVDDGSTDNSREIISSYGNRIIAVVKKNGGQASAFNAGFAASRGQVIIFLDSDDILLASAVEKAVSCFDGADVCKAHWPMYEVDSNGIPTGKINPALPVSEGDLRAALVEHGPPGYIWPPTSGNAWGRIFLQRIFPLPEREYTKAADYYLSALVPLFGVVRRVDEPQSLYRIHGSNTSWKIPLDENIVAWLKQMEHSCGMAATHARELNVTIDVNSWRNAPYVQWLERVGRMIAAIADFTPDGGNIVLLDQGEWLIGSDRRITRDIRAIPFTEKGGLYWGPPADGSAAIREVERLRNEQDARSIVFAWPNLWLLDYYSDLRDRLQVEHACLAATDSLVAFDLTR